MATPGSTFYREYDVADARRRGGAQTPAPHQGLALQALDRWYRSDSAEPRGGILVLPTGGGKTFTAGHFLCRDPLSEGYKVLWLAHTHHLLEQAFGGFERLVGLVAEPRAGLNVRVVSGTIGHFPVHAIRPTDDVLIGSVQTMGNALENGHERLAKFLDGAAGKLCVVFDEAHHAPAPSYRRLIQGLRDRCPKMHLLGLTATPTHGEVKKRGWLARLFPQGIVYEVDPQALMAAGVLARPVLEEARTDFEPTFDEREYEQWVGTNRDLPEDVIDTLATSRERNDRIVGHYVANRKRYGKTIIFADRWPQCEYLREALRKRGVRADAIYSHVDANPGSVEGRARRRASENATVLADFRAGNLDVLVNIRMATEGTDVPDVQTVFLTRQTTSQILLTQMIGRALRGPKFGGTDQAFIVSFIDDWRQRINWAAYDRLAARLADETVPEYGVRPPLQLISIDLVRRLARQMDSGVNVNPAPFRTFLPVGWYRVEYAARVDGTADDESVGLLVMVFEDERRSFEKLITALKKADLEAFEDPAVHLDDVHEAIDEWESDFFSEAGDRIGGGLAVDLFSIARHMAQNDREPPRFFPFGVRDDHDLDAVAGRVLAEDLGPRRQDETLQAEYTRRDRYWRVIYHTYGQFKSHFDACMNRLLDANRHGADAAGHRPTFRTPEAVPLAEPPEDLKDRVKSRDGYRCLCCGYAKRRTVLAVDHISPSYHGGSNHFDNLQTLCKTCNTAKGIDRISFRNHQTALTAAPPRLPATKFPAGENARDPEWWEMYLRRTLNLFYRCAAVDSVQIGARGERFRHWQVRLFPGNDPSSPPTSKPWPRRSGRPVRRRATPRHRTRSRSPCSLEGMHVELLHPVPHTPLHAALDGVFRTASRVQLAVAFLTGPGASTFLRLVPAGKVREASRVVASIRWPTNLDALAQMSAQMPGGVYLHRGLFLPEETNHDRPLMHSKVAYVDHVGSHEVDVLVGSHNWTGQALDGNNLEASVRVRCLASDPFAADTLRHLNACFAESELFDPARLDDYKAIQAALHGGPPGTRGEAAGFVKDSVVVIHTEEEPGLSERLGELHLYLPVYDAEDDELFGKDQQIHLYVYERGKLFESYDPLQQPKLYIGRVDMSNRPNDRVQRRVDCTIKDFARPELTSLVDDNIPEHSRPLVRQLVAVLEPEQRRRVLFYHRGSGGPRVRRQVEGRPPSPDELANLATGQVAPVGRRPIQPGAYTRASVGPDGAFVYAVPADPNIHCVVSLPGRRFYPAELESDFLSRFHRLREEDRSRFGVAFEACPTFREYVYRCTHRADFATGDWS